MKPFCEVIVTDVLPALRALVTYELMNTYGLNQVEIAKKLGITQPAISQYIKGLRGHKVKILAKNESVMRMIRELSKEIANDSIRPREICMRFCEICKVVRKEKLICELHESKYPAIAPCDICLR
ncbi:MAG TPA: helix-turn-helix domain-containing protein [Candidatus Aenigmarchaeota archaeon]|nr:helix-turn-helix domain-containing protein [Candidatus Aenigmarchaeota archaeon]